MGRAPRTMRKKEGSPEKKENKRKFEKITGHPTNDVEQKPLLHDYKTKGSPMQKNVNRGKYIRKAPLNEDPNQVSNEDKDTNQGKPTKKQNVGQSNKVFGITQNNWKQKATPKDPVPLSKEYNHRNQGSPKRKKGNQRWIDKIIGKTRNYVVENALPKDQASPKKKRRET